MTNRELVLGAEAIAIAALDEGIAGVYAYPGTPSTEITEYIQNSVENSERKIHSSWSANEKTAYEAALGMSYAGMRSLVCMKHVGLNVAADALMNSAITGINGGMVLAVADDPSMHSSQNEQDSRFYARFAYLPFLEPSNQQEAYDITRYAFNLSEKSGLPVIIRITTRLSHSRSAITRTKVTPVSKLDPVKNSGKWILLPANARRQYEKLISMQNNLVLMAESSNFNFEVPGVGNRAVIAFGLAYNYVMEINNHYGLNLPVLKISQYPLPEKLVSDFCRKYESLLIAEEGYPIYEELIRGIFRNPDIHGRLDGTLPRTGELSPDVLKKALTGMVSASTEIPEVLASRPPQLCQGCSHRDLYEALNVALDNYPEKYVFSDIGCYTLGALPPYKAIDTCVDMGASVTMAKGAADAGLFPSIAVIGDSTFTHSGMTGLLDVVNDNNNVTIIISDNQTTAMTGGQNSPGTDRLFDICKGLGVDKAHIRTIVPLKKNLENNIGIIKEELEYKGVSVILACRECIQTARKKHK